MDEVQGIPVLEFRFESMVGTPIQQRMTEVQTPAVQTGAVNGEPRVETQQNLGNRATWVSLFPVNGLDLSTAQNQENGEGNVKITFEDIQLEVEYWTSAVLCHVWGQTLHCK